MTSEQLALCVMFHIKAEHVDEFASMVKENMSETRKDEGVMAFDFRRVAGEPAWVLYEVWESEYHFNLHRQTPFLQAFSARRKILQAREPEIYRLEPSA